MKIFFEQISYSQPSIIKGDDIFLELTGRKLFCYTEYDGFCLSIDLISEEDAQELINNDPDEAFDGCGVEEVFRNGTTKLQAQFFDMDLVNKIIEDNDVEKFMQLVVNAGYAEKFVDEILDFFDDDEMDEMEVNDIRDLCHKFVDAGGKL